VHNNLAVDDVPPELAGLEKLEQILVSQRIVFQKIVVMPKGQERKIRGAICNVPVSCEETCHILPRPPGIYYVKIKEKIAIQRSCLLSGSASRGSATSSPVASTE